MRIGSPIAPVFHFILLALFCRLLGRNVFDGFRRSGSPRTVVAHELMLLPQPTGNSLAVSVAISVDWQAVARSVPLLAKT